MSSSSYKDFTTLYKLYSLGLKIHTKELSGTFQVVSANRIKPFFLSLNKFYFYKMTKALYIFK